MALNPIQAAQELEVLFSGAVQNYIFNYCFQQRNPGKEFDLSAWTDAVTSIIPNGLNSLDALGAEKLRDLQNNLDQFAVEPQQKRTKLNLEGGEVQASKKLTLV